MKLEKKYKILIVTGISGAGRSSALKILEDMGFEAIDNLPTYLLSKIIDSKAKKNLAIGIDARSRDFNPKKVANEILKKKKTFNISLIFFDCDNSNLLNRFKESRRLHPMKLDLPITEIIQKERNWIRPLLDINDYYIDTSRLTINLLKSQLQLFFKNISKMKTLIRIISFGYKYGLPQEADIVFDMRFIKNPYYEKDLRDLDGKNEKVINFVKKQKYFDFFFDNLFVLFKKTLEGFKKEGKDYITIAFGCTGGVHRSVVSSEYFYSEINEKNMKVFIEHRDLKK
jgi:UPF0042 nucleotide-binding protein